MSSSRYATVKAEHTMSWLKSDKMRRKDLSTPAILITGCDYVWTGRNTQYQEKFGAMHDSGEDAQSFHT